jgi:hypothetical protein
MTNDPFTYMKSDVQHPVARHLSTPCDKSWTMRLCRTTKEFSLPVCKLCEAHHAKGTHGTERRK